MSGVQPPSTPGARNVSPQSPRRVWIQNPRRGGVLLWLLRYFCFAFLCSLPFWAALLWAVFLYFSKQVPAVQEVARYAKQAPGITRIYGAQGHLLAEVAREYRAYASIDQIPPRLIQAFLAAEDRRFYRHHGLDLRGLTRAMVANIRSGTIVQGGSTITQQVAKSFLKNQQRTLSRKGVEAILALKIESTLGKQNILETYLNKIFLGHNAYGVAAAAERYFAKDLSELSLSESAMIAGLARAPSRFNPSSHPKRALRRRNVVLQDMFEAGYIDKKQLQEALKDPIETKERPKVFRQRAPYFAESVRQSVVEELGEDALVKDGLRIESALDLRMQDAARRQVDRAVRKLDRKHGWMGPVAHLRAPQQQEEFLRRCQKRYGPSPFIPPRERSTAAQEPLSRGKLSGQEIPDPKDRWYLALVQRVEARFAKIQVGDTPALLPLSQARWANALDPNSGVNGETIADLRRALQPGDVVWVHATGRRSKMGAKGNPPALPEVRLGQNPRVQAALWTHDHQKGYVEAMVGGTDYDKSQFNRAQQACRQPGSVFKALYFALALDGDYQADSILEAKPWQPEPGEDWNPRNIGRTIDGKVLLRTALIKSMNTPSIRLFVALGAPAVVEWSRNLGIRSKLIADKGLSLGASCVRHDEIAQVFSTYARGGSRIGAHPVKRVVDKLGQTRLDHRSILDPGLSVADRLDLSTQAFLQPPPQIMRESTAFLISRLLREVVTKGIGARASQTGVPVAGKSGSASGRFQRERGIQDLTTDTWFVGFSSRHTTSAWMGFDDANWRSMGDDEASYTTATPLWTDYMQEVVAGERDSYQKLPMHRPPGLVTRDVDATHGGPPVPGMPSAQIFARRGAKVPPSSAELESSN